MVLCPRQTWLQTSDSISISQISAVKNEDRMDETKVNTLAIKSNSSHHNYCLLGSWNSGSQMEKKIV